MENILSLVQSQEKTIYDIAETIEPIIILFNSVTILSDSSKVEALQNP